MPTIDKVTAIGFLQDVSPLWRAFWFHMHLMAKNLDELAAGLEAISDEVYTYHQEGHQNDVARWVQEVVGDAELGDQLKNVPTHGQAAGIVRARTAELRAVVARG